jgi:ElaB/YqjD/DUF883 family membrane-anchored ribosome-binding protein
MAETNYRSLSDDTWRAPSAHEEAGDMVTDTANRVSEFAMQMQERVTQYFREHDVRDMLEDVNQFVKRHPAQALAAAAAVGFLAAAVLRRR